VTRGERRERKGMDRLLDVGSTNRAPSADVCVTDGGPS
jgi:hypothetical protein